MKKNNHLKKLAILLLVACFLIPINPPEPAAAADKDIAPKIKQITAPKKILFIGNSYTYYNDSLHNKLRDLIGEADKDNFKTYTLRSMTISGGRLSDHAYGIQGILDPEKKKTSLSLKWDVVILQGHSREPIDKKMSDNFKATARKYNKIIRDAGAGTVFFMTWAYSHKPEMTQPLSQAYTNIANELDAFVVPAGLAFQRAIKEKPGIVMYNQDKSHPSLMGTYLAACVFYGAFYNKSPVGIGYTAGLPKADGQFLQKVAWDTVLGFYKR